jgi:uncharacterized membrane protein YbhN (UPF0104 family)
MADDRVEEVVEADPLDPMLDTGERQAEELVSDDQDQDFEERGRELLTRRRLISLGLAVALMVVAIYIVFPKVVGVEGAVLDRVGEATWYWVVIAIPFNLLAFVAYAMLFRGVLGVGGRGDEPGDEVRRRLDMRVSYKITMSGYLATILFSAAGAGGLALTYWALRKAGMPRGRAACRMVAFLVLLYSVYLASLVVFGTLLRVGVLHGDDPVGGTIVPAVVGAVALLILALVSFIPGDVERRMGRYGTRSGRLPAFAARVARVPAVVATGVRTALAYIRHPQRSANALVGAVGWWAGNIGVLWASFHSFGVDVPFGVLVQGFFVGMVANLAPSPAGGVGTVDAGLIGSFVLFGIPADQVFPAVLLFRAIGFAIPIPLGIWGYIGLRRTVRRWAEEDRGATIQSKVSAETR